MEPGVILGDNVQLCPGIDCDIFSTSRFSSLLNIIFIDHYFIGTTLARDLEVMQWPIGISLPRGAELVRVALGCDLPLGFAALAIDPMDPFKVGLPPKTIIVKVI